MKPNDYETSLKLYREYLINSLNDKDFDLTSIEDFDTWLEQETGDDE